MTCPSYPILIIISLYIDEQALVFGVVDLHFGLVLDLESRSREEAKQQKEGEQSTHDIVQCAYKNDDMPY